MNFATFFQSHLAGGSIERYWSAAGWTMVHFLWLGTAIGLAAWGLRRALRPLGPRVCYIAMLVSLLAMPAAAVRLFGWVLERTPAALDVGPVAVSLAIPAAQPAPVAAAPQPVTPNEETATIPPGDLLWRETSGWVGEFARHAPWLWLAGTPLTLAFLGLGLVGSERLRRESRMLHDGEIVQATRRLASVLRVSRRVSVAACDRVVAPMLLGVLRPLILLPPAVLSGHSAAQIEMILLHELAHVRRWDNLVNLGQRIVEAALFFHPAVWIISRWVRLEREHCCDEVVLSHTGDPQAYAETLAALAIPGLSPAHAAAAMANHQLVTRIRQILDIEERSMSVSGKMISLAAGVSITAALIVGAYAQSKPIAIKADVKPVPQSEKSADAVDRAVVQRLLADSFGDPKVDDAAFYRRVRLDLTGTLPTGEEIKAFLEDASPQKRERLLESLLAGEKLNRYEAAYVAQSLAAKPASGDAVSSIESGATSAGPRGVPGINLATAAKRPYGAEQLTGPPDAAMGCDSQSAWCSLTADDQEEWLELEYAEPVWAVAVLVYANCSPGAISQVQIHSAEQPGLSFTWADRDPTAKTVTHGISVIPLASQMRTRRIKVTLDSKNTPGWNEIDAVGLLDGQGKVHWATSAKASSTYADAVTRSTGTVGFDRIKGQAKVAQWPLIDGVVKQGDLLLALSETSPRLCYVILLGERGDGRVIRYTLSGKETVLDVLAKVAPDVQPLDRRRVWILRPSAGQDGIDRILHPNREAIRNGNAETNYEVLPGDRIFISADAGETKSSSTLQSDADRLSKPSRTPQEAFWQSLFGADQAAEAQRQRAIADQRAAEVAEVRRRESEAAVQRSHDWLKRREAANETESAAQAVLDQKRAAAAIEAAEVKRREDAKNSDQGLVGSLTAAELLSRQLSERQRLVAEAQRAAAQMAVAKAEAKKLQDMLAQQERIIQDLQAEANRFSTAKQPGSAPPPTVAIDEKSQTEAARVSIKALLGQSATAAFADGVRFHRVAVDGDEIAFASIAKPNEVIVCGKRTGKAEVRAYDDSGKLYRIDVEFVDPPPMPNPAR